MHEPLEAQATIAQARCLPLQGRGDRQASPDLVGGSGSYETTRQAPGRTPRQLTRSVGFHLSKTMDQECLQWSRRFSLTSQIVWPRKSAWRIPPKPEQLLLKHGESLSECDNDNAAAYEELVCYLYRPAPHRQPPL